MRRKWHQYAEEKEVGFSFDLKEESEDECLAERGTEFQITGPVYWKDPPTPPQVLLPILGTQSNKIPTLKTSAAGPLHSLMKTSTPQFDPRPKSSRVFGLVKTLVTVPLIQGVLQWLRRIQAVLSLKMTVLVTQFFIWWRLGLLPSFYLGEEF